MTTPGTGKNQITVPAEITQKLGLAAGAQFDWAVGDQPNKITITIEPTRRLEMFLGESYRVAHDTNCQRR